MQEQGDAIWADLRAGDSPAQVADKLQAMPGIKSAKVRGRQNNHNVKIAYREEGVPILSQRFKLNLDFQNEGLMQVSLISDPECINDVFEKFEKLDTLLAEKYPRSIGPKPTESDFYRAIAEAREDAPQRVSAIHFDENVGVVLAQQITRKEAPQSEYVSSKFFSAVQDMLWSEYRTHVDQCSYRGQYRSVTVIAYLPREVFDARFKEAAQEMRQEQEEAIDNL